MAPIDGKGTAMGVYSTSQFFGAFLGGTAGGVLFGAFGLEGVFFVCSFVALLWVAVAAGMIVPSYLSNYMTHVDTDLLGDIEALNNKLLAISGVHESKIVREEGIAYLRIDKKKFNPEDVEKVLTQA
jgi:MFS family permease